MPGRFSLIASRDEFESYFGVILDTEFPPLYNIAPTQPIFNIVTAETALPGSNRPNRRATLVRWGFIPGWVKNPDDWPLMINMRSETAAQKNSFKTAMAHGRSLVPASGFYEWRKIGKDKKQAYWIKPRHGGLVAFAGLMETWSGADGSQIDTGGLLTVDANKSLSIIHHRMPVIIHPENFEEWLDCKRNRSRDVAHLLVTVDDDFFEAIPISDKVNKVSNNSAELLEPISSEFADSLKYADKSKERNAQQQERVNDHLDKQDDQFSLF